MTPRRVARRMPFMLAALALATMVAAPANASASALRAAARGGIGLRLLDVPVSAGSDPRAQIYIVDHLAPGTTIHRRIEISNTTNSTAQVILYAAAATIEDGSFLGAAGHTPNDLSSWTSVSPDSSDVASGGTGMALVTISVPIDASSGEKYGVVWAEVRSAPTADGGVIQISRVGIRLYVSVGPGGTPSTNFTIDSITAMRSHDGRPMVLATVHNPGGRALDMSGTLRLLDGPGGLRAGPFPATLGTTLAIGDTEPVAFTLDSRLPPGPWDARITLASGLFERSARATITFLATGASPPVDTTSSRSVWPYLAAALVFLLLLFGILTLFVSLRRRRRPSTGPSPQPGYERGSRRSAGKGVARPASGIAILTMPHSKRVWPQ